MKDAVMEAYQLTKTFDLTGTSTEAKRNWLNTIAATLRRKEKERIVALDHVNLKVRKGEIFGLIGPNGAGKTTFIKIFCTLLLPDEGKAWVHDLDVVEEAEKVKPLISFVPATSWYIFDKQLSIWDNLWYYATLYGIKNRKERINEVLELVDLKDREQETIQSFSSGMRQRLVIAKGMLPKAPLMFMDEPTIGIDPHGAKSIRNMLHQMSRKEGCTVFFTTHYLNEAEILCDRVAVLSHGKILSLGTPESILSGLAQNTYLIQAVNARPQLRDSLLKTPGVKEASLSLLDSTIGRFDIRTQLEENAAPDEIISTIRRQKAIIKSIHKVKPTLEDAYLSLMSRRKQNEK